jgi:hypothetical protein
MIEDKKDDEIIDVKEEVDGSAVIELPESIPSPDVQEVVKHMKTLTKLMKLLDKRNGRRR